MLEPAHQTRVKSTRFGGEFDLVDARQQIFVRDLHLESREVSAQTEVLPNPEAQMSSTPF